MRGRTGMQRDLFVPCIESLKVRNKVVKMQSTVDYRMDAVGNALASRKKASAGGGGGDDDDGAWVVSAPR